MGKLMFGTQEDVVCITDVAIKGKDGEALCLAYKASTHFVAAGIYVTDDGYVLKPKDVAGRYYPLEPEALREYQAASELPSPLPAYTLPWSTYVWGYSLWIVIAATIAFSLLQRALAARKRARMAALRHDRPIDMGPPALRTSGDAFIADQVRPLLRPGESVMHQAYGVDRDVSTAGAIGAMAARGVFAVLTSQRLFLVATRVGAVRPVLENHGVEAIERDAIAGLEEDAELLIFGLNDGSQRVFHVHVKQKAFSNQAAFLADVPRILSQTHAAASQSNQPGAASFVAPPSPPPPPPSPPPRLAPPPPPFRP